MVKIKKDNDNSNMTLVNKDTSAEKTVDAVCLGVITAAHGLRGQVKMKIFAEDPFSLCNYDNLYTNKNLQGEPVKISKIKDTQKGDYIVSLEGISNRTQAEAMRGSELFVHRDELPDLTDEEEFYYHDLVGCETYLNDKDSTKYGTVKAIFNFGGDDLIELEPNNTDSKSVVLTFSKENIPVVDLKANRIVVDAESLKTIENLDNSKDSKDSKNSKRNKNPRGK